MKLLLKLLLFSLLLPLATGAYGANICQGEAHGDSLEVSLLTCAPGHQIYRLYGHTALRINNTEKNSRDFAYNYGWFSFDTPNFVMKFILGLTDYSMARESTALFAQSYLQDDMPVTQQVLNLTPEEARRVQHALDEIITRHKGEHKEYIIPDMTGGQDTLSLDMPKWTYRYNFLYDNCTTRAVDLVRKVLEANGEQIIYPDKIGDRTPITQRQMIHEFTHRSPWYEFGQDLLLGPEVDRPHTMEEMTRLNFLPTYAQDFWQKAKIKSADGQLRPLVLVAQPLIPIKATPQQPSTPLTPSFVFWSLFALAVALTVGEQRTLRRDTATRRAWNIWMGTFDTIVLVAMGLVGCLLTLMVGWSEHPAVGTNWLLTVFTPLWLLYLPFRFGLLRRWRMGYSAALLSLGALAFFICFAFGDQWFPRPTIPLASILLLRGIALCRKTGLESRSRTL